MFNLYNSSNVNTYLLLKEKGICKLKKIVYTLNAVEIYVYNNENIEYAEITNIEYILTIDEPTYLTLYGNTIDSVKNDMKNSPLLLKFVLALLNKDYNNIDIYLQKDENIRLQFLNYINIISEQEKYIDFAIHIFMNYLEYKSKLI